MPVNILEELAIWACYTMGVGCPQPPPPDIDGDGTSGPPSPELPAEILDLIGQMIKLGKAEKLSIERWLNVASQLERRGLTPQALEMYQRIPQMVEPSNAKNRAWLTRSYAGEARLRIALNEPQLAQGSLERIEHINAPSHRRSKAPSV